MKYIYIYIYNMRGCNGCVIDGTDLSCAPSGGNVWHNTHTKFHDDSFEHSSNVNSVASKM
jgi:hypothetical protein